MEHIYKNQILTLYFKGELNSSNANIVDNEIEQILDNKDIIKIILDFDQLNYISSAGLRIILKLKKKYDDLIIDNVSLEVYDILQMTGFTEMMQVNRALNKVDISNAKVIGEGYFSTVYRINKDTIIKVFNKTSDPNQIERELTRAKQAFVLGIPTAISFDIVKVGNKLGVRFEMLDCKTLKDCFLDDNYKYDELIEKYVCLLKKINTTECMSSDIPVANKTYLEKLEVIKPYFEEKYNIKLHKMFENIKESRTFVHGDCHMKNVMVQDDELLLIDMDTLSVGNPIFELAALCASHLAFQEEDPTNSEKFFGLKAEFVSKMFFDVMNAYFDKFDEDKFNKIRIVCYVFMAWWNLINEKENLSRFERARKNLISLLDKYDNLDIGL